MNLKLGELEFILLKDDDATRAYAKVLAGAYKDRLSAAADWLLAQKEFGVFFPGVTQTQIKAGLGAPLITLLSAEDGTVTFPGAKFGDTRHLVSFEFTGALEQFDYLSIDG